MSGKLSELQVVDTFEIKCIIQGNLYPGIIQETRSVKNKQQGYQMSNAFYDD